MRLGRTGRRILVAFVALVFLFLYGPIIAVVLLSFGDSISVLRLTDPTIRWYEKLAHNTEVINAFWFSLKLGLFSTAIATVLGTMAAVPLVRQRIRGKGLLRALILAPMIVPDIVLAVALLVLFTALGVPRGWPTLVIGHSLLLLPYVVTVVSSRLYGLDWTLEEAALSLGARPWRVYSEILLPLLAPAIVGAAIIAFKVSFNEVVGALFWSSLREQTLPVVVLGMLNWELTPEVNAVGTMMILVTAGLLGVQQVLGYMRSRRMGPM